MSLQTRSGTGRATGFRARSAGRSYDPTRRHDLPDDPATATLAFNLTALARLAGRLCGVEDASITVHDPDGGEPVNFTGRGFARIRPDDDLMTRFETSEPVIVTDAAADARFCHHPLVTGPARIRFFACAPITSSHGLPLGVLTVRSDTPRTCDEQQVSDLQMVVRQVAEVLELRRRTLQLHGAVDELMRSNALLSDFARRMSHDLKAPLTAVIGFGETLCERLGPKTPGERDRDAWYADRIVACGRRMHELIENMLSFATVSGQPQMRLLDVREIVADVLVDLAPLVARTGAVVRAEHAALRADPVQVRALMQNLVGNALIYAHREEGDLIEVVVSHQAQHWRLSVVDHGPGIPVGDRDHVLEPLVRLARDVDLPGTGIGLATCQRIAQAHGGTLEITETPGGGSTVTMVAPQPYASRLTRAVALGRSAGALREVGDR